MCLCCKSEISYTTFLTRITISTIVIRTMGTTPIIRVINVCWNFWQLGPSMKVKTFKQMHARELWGPFLVDRSIKLYFIWEVLVTTKKVAPRHEGGLLCLRGIIKRSKIRGNCHLRVLTVESQVKTSKKRQINFIMFYFNFFCIPFWQTFERSTL